MSKKEEVELPKEEVEEPKIGSSPGLQDYIGKELEVEKTNGYGVKWIKAMPVDIMLKGLDNIDDIDPAIRKVPGSKSPNPGKGNIQKRTEEYPYVCADIKALIKAFKVTYEDLANCIGVDYDILKNQFKSDLRRFTRQDFNVILKAITTIYEAKGEDLQLI